MPLVVVFDSSLEEYQLHYRRVCVINAAPFRSRYLHYETSARRPPRRFWEGFVAR